jgi:ABC-2 type transport system permease protein
MAMILIAMRFGFDVPIQGSVLFLFGTATIYLFALLALGLFISTATTTMAQAMQVSMMLVLPSIFLSGYIFPQSGLPRPLYFLGLVFPATHMIAIMRAVVLRDAGPMDVVPPLLALLALSVILVWASAGRFKKVVV